MEKVYREESMMDTKLSLYDFLAYIIPGTVVLILLYWLYVEFFASPLTSRITLPDTVWFLVFLTVGYFLGHVVQAAGSQRQKMKEKKEGWLSETYLRDDSKSNHDTSECRSELKEAMLKLKKVIEQLFGDDSDSKSNHYTPAYRSKLKKAIEQCFGLEVSTQVSPEGGEEQKGGGEQEDNRKRQQEIFYLCSALLPEEMKTKADIFRAAAALYRGLYCITFLGMIVSAAALLKQLLLLMFIYIPLMRLPQGDFLAFDGIHLVFDLILLFAFYFSGLWLEQRRKDNTGYYVDTVYTNFYVWYTKRSKPDAYEELLSQQSSLVEPKEGKNGSLGKQ